MNRKRSAKGKLPPAYALLEVMVVLVICALLIARFHSLVAELLLVPFVSMVNVCMLRLMRDIDNPFDYRSDGTASGAAEVSLFPLHGYRARLSARLDEVPAQSAGGSAAGADA